MSTIICHSNPVMSSSNLESLPTEVLIYLLDYIDSGLHPNLHAFAAVSRRCRAIARVRSHRVIHLKLESHEKLLDDLEHWRQILDGAGSRRYVWRLELKGYILPIDPNPSPDSDDMDPRQLQLLLNFIEYLPALQDVEWRIVGDNPPACILNAMEQRIPIIRLHHHTFRLRSLIQSRTELAPIDPYEYALITSPCLHSITAEVQYWGHDGLIDYMPEALGAMLHGLSPKLRHIELIPNRAPNASFEMQRSIHLGRPTWKGFELNGLPVLSQAGCLHSLNIGGYLLGKSISSISFAQLIGNIVSQAGCLHSLNFGGYLFGKFIDPISFAQLKHLKINFIDTTRMDAIRVCSFPVLEDLEINVGGPKETLECLDAINDFLRSLRPLRCFRIKGPVGKTILDAIVDAHASKLRLLVLDIRRNPRDSDGRFIEQLIFNAETIDRLQSFPHLEELHIPTPRSKSDEKEAAVYRALGTLPAMKRLNLALDCSCTDIMVDAEETPSHPDFNDYESQLLADGNYWKIPRVGHVQNSLINCIVDDALVHDILGTIYDAQPRNRIHLEQIHLRVAGGWNFAQISVNLPDGVLCALAWAGEEREWKCTLSPRDDCKEYILVEVPSGERQRRMVGVQDSVGEEVRSILERMWETRSWHKQELRSIRLAGRDRVDE